jgi:hypothetical protein
MQQPKKVQLSSPQRKLACGVAAVAASRCAHERQVLRRPLSTIRVALSVGLDYKLALARSQVRATHHALSDPVCTQCLLRVQL